MICPRFGHGRFHGEHDWLDTYHTFSFGDYHDPSQMGFRALRVINEDRIAPGKGFGMHGHRDIEIVTIVLSGALEHRDSLGNSAVLKPGEVQHMSAGRGIRHCEMNPSESDPVHLYQIWLLPDQKGRDPGYSQKAFDRTDRINRWQQVASPDGAAGSLVVGQDVRAYLASLDAGRDLAHALGVSRCAWLQVLQGAIRFGEWQLSAGDGAAISDEPKIAMFADSTAEILLFDLA